jgi:hypothetical protein
MLSGDESPEAREAASWGEMTAHPDRRLMRGRARKVRARALGPRSLLHWTGIVAGAAAFAAGLAAGWLIWG